MVQERLEPICKNFGDILVDEIIEIDGLEMINRGRPKPLGYQSNKSMIVILEQMIIPKKVSDCFEDTFLNITPILHVEQGCKTFRTRDLKGAQACESMKNLNLGWNSTN